jgi:hypothetical protein
MRSPQAGINELAVRCVVSEKKRAQIRAPTFWVHETDNDKFILVDTFDLAPEAAIARLVWRVDALRDDAFGRMLADRIIKRLAVTDHVVDKADVLGRPP